MDKKDITELAVLSNEMGNVKTAINEVKGDVKEIKTLMGAYKDTFVSKEEFAMFKKQYWLTHTLTALIVAGITYLVAYFVMGKGGGA